MKVTPFRPRHRFAWVALTFCLSMLTQANGFRPSAVSDRQPQPRPKSEDRVVLVHADDWLHDQFAYPDAQRFKGHVQFRHGGMDLKCDSAVFFQASNSFEAYGHVHMVQGDTLSLTCDRLYYHGDDQIAEARKNVVLKHRGQTLKTDSLNYDRFYSFAYYYDGGRLIDGENTLTSDWGEYHTDTRQSTFNYNVELVNPRFRIVTDTLHYNLDTKWADLAGPSNVYSDDSRIYTERGRYNTQTELSAFYDRSQIFNKEAKVVGDSLFYNKQTGDMYAYKDVVYDDAKSKCTLMGDYCHYNELTGIALAHDRALAKDYSNVADTLFVHADTLRLYTYNIGTDSVYRRMHGYFHARAYRSDVQAVADSLVFDSRERLLSLYRDPIVWSDGRQVVGEQIDVYANDSTIDSIYVREQAMLVERLDSIHYNQVAGKLMRSYFERGQVKLNCVDGNVYVVNFPLEKDSTILYQNYTETAKLRMYMKNRRMKRLWAPASKGCFYVAGLAPQERTRLEGFAWFDYIRPVDKYDLFEWRPKHKGSELKPPVRHEAPIQTIKATP